MDGRFDAVAGARLKAIRHERGWRRLDVEDRLGWPPGTLRYLERGKVRLTFEHASVIGAMYEYALDELMELVGRRRASVIA